MAAKDVISSLTDDWGPEVHTTSLKIAILNNDHAMIEQLLKPKLKGVTKQNTYANLYSQTVGNRIVKPGNLIEHQDTGKVSFSAYGTAVRKV